MSSNPNEREGDKPDNETGYVEEPTQTTENDEAAELVRDTLPKAEEEEDWGDVVLATDLSELVFKDGENAIGGGGFGDVYKGTWVDNPLTTNKNSTSSSLLKGINRLTRMTHIYDKPVAIKVIRPLVADGTLREAVKRRLAREIGLWQRLHHENILPLLGVSYKFGALPSPISQWQANGTIKSYLESFPDANRHELLRGVARGLAFLHDHSPMIVHGDMKPENILINDWGGPYLSDFGISAVYDEHTFWVTATTSVKGTARYMSPELMSGDIRRPTPASDAYAYAMTALQIMTGRPPFHYYMVDPAVIMHVIGGGRPNRPKVDEEAEPISEDLWNLMTECWAQDPATRPPMSQAVKKLTKMCAAERPLRLLSIDGGGISIIASLMALKALMKEVGFNAKPCDYFDMIAGSETGGVVALMLGRLRMSINECITEIQNSLKNLFDVSIDKQRKRSSKEKFRFSWGNFDESLRPMINARVAPEARAMPDTRRNLCRTFVIGQDKDTKEHLRIRTYKTPEATPFPHRVWVGMAATMATPLKFEQVFGEKTSMALFNNPDFSHINPSLELLEEARSVFGDHRRISVFISLGNGLSTQAVSPDSKLTEGLPDPLISKLRSEALAKTANHLKLIQNCEPGAYYRFDPADFSDQHMNDTTLWQEAYAFEQVSRMSDLKDLMELYLQDELIGQQLKECANRLPRPKRHGSTTSSLSLDSLSISRSSTITSVS